jgi:uncharacterized UBP type Zn finger protein
MTDTIKNTIDNFDYGFVFTPIDFPIDPRKQATVNRILNNMVAAGQIRRVSKVRFYKPKMTEFGELPPNIYVKQDVSFFIADYLTVINRQDLIEKYELKPFLINVLDKRRTITEKLVSLIRFSFEEDVRKALAAKIRHFYDLYYLANDTECAEYINSTDFQKDLQELFLHDQKEFDKPKVWQTKTVKDSPLLKEFPTFWTSLRSTYQFELTPLAFSEIPDEKLIEESFIRIMEKL